MNKTQSQIDALIGHGERLCTMGKWTSRIALCLFGCLLALWWPEPVGQDAIGDYVSVPEPLFRLLEAQGVAVRRFHQAALRGNPFLWTAFVIPIFLISGAALRRWIPNAWLRRAVIAIALMSPDWLLSVVPHGAATTTPAARHGILVDHSGAPPAVPDYLTSSVPVPAHRLDPRAFAQPLADQVHFVLAQQAYFDGKPAAIKSNLDALSGQWHPGEPDRTAIGLMIEHAAAHGLQVTGVAPAITGGAPHSARRINLFYSVEYFALAFFTAGIGLHLIGGRRKRRAGKLGEQLRSLVPTSDPLIAPIVQSRPAFGRRQTVVS